MCARTVVGFYMDNLANGGLSSSSLSASNPDQEKQIVKQLTNEAELSLKEGNLYFVISARWFLRWERYVGQTAGDCLSGWQSSDCQNGDDTATKRVDRPGPIDNSDIVESESHSEGGELDLVRTLLEGKDYVLVPQQVWEKLLQWYKGGPALPRKMISQGIFDKRQLNVEVYPLRLKLIDFRDQSISTIRLSKKATSHELYEKVCALKGVEREKCLLWDYFNKRRHSRLLYSRHTLEELNLQMDQEILLELQVDLSNAPRSGRDSTGNELAVVPLEPLRTCQSIAGGSSVSNGHSTSYSLNTRLGKANSNFNDTNEDFDSQNSSREGEKGGLAGLQNLGNTCFMNSALQCLVHTPPLVDYFLQDYTAEINKENPLGMNGELALAFGGLLRKLWSSGQTAIAPRAFKGKLALFAPQFSGYNQHDSQELLAFLLDGLHEDLNRVKRKPYIEMKDRSGHPDDEVAAESWKYHKARNDSVIVDVCQGQYKSTLVCPDCSKVSVTFDPLMYLSLPLPSTVTRSMTVTVFYGDGSGLPMPYTVSVFKHGQCKDLNQALSAACCLRTDESLLLAEVYEHKIYHFFENPSQLLTSIKDEEHLVAYRLPVHGGKKKKLEVIHRERSSVDFLNGGVGKYFGAPLVTYLEGDLPTGADIDDIISRLLSPLKRTCASMLAFSGREDSVAANGETSGRSRDDSMDDIVEEDGPNQLLSNQLFFIDDQGSTCKRIFRDSVIKTSNHTKIFLDWTEEEHKLYDSSYLKDLPDVYHKTGFTAKKTRQEAVSLFSCLEAFLREEPLGPDDMWYCPNCKEHRQATKKLDLWMLPEILVVHMKRFSYSRFLKNKLNTFVDFPIHNLDLSKYVKQKDDEKSCTYDLYAISNHYGGLGGGHYTAYAKLIDENRWYNFDDSRVTPVNESDIKTSAAYVLFYRRVKPESQEDRDIQIS
ncbi:Ubiquitin carboxyl-terminal hydrolase 9 [Linum perenne]